MEKVHSEAYSKQRKLTNLRKLSTTPKLMPWEVRHQHTMKTFLLGSHNTQASSKVAVKENTLSALEDVTDDSIMSEGHDYLRESSYAPAYLKEGSFVGSDTDRISTGRVSTGSTHESPKCNIARHHKNTLIHREPSQNSRVSEHPNIRGDTTSHRTLIVNVGEAEPIGENGFNIFQNLMKSKTTMGDQEFSCLDNKSSCSCRKCLQPEQESIATLNKPLKYAKKYNLDDVFNYAFPCGKEPLRKRLL